MIYAGTQGHIDKVAVARVREWEAGFVRFLKSERQSVLDAIEKQKALDDTLFARLKAAISTFNHQFGVEGYQDVPDPSGPPADGDRPAGKPEAEAAAKTEATTAAKTAV